MTYRLIARVHGVTENTRHFVATTNGEPEKVEVPVTVSVTEGDGGYYLLRIDGHGNCLADTWHVSIIEAKEQASFEFGIHDTDWSTA